MSGFSNATDGDFDRVFTTTSEIIDRFVGTKLWMCGHNSYGAVGDNTQTHKSTPVQTVAGGTIWQCIACGIFHTAAIKTDGTLWSWGRDDYGQLGDNTVVHKSSPVQSVAGGTNWKSVACGFHSTAAIKTDGTLWSWGRNDSGQLSDNTVVSKSSPVQIYGGGTNWSQVSCGSSHTVAVKTDGTLWSWGNNTYGQLCDNTSAHKSSPVQTIAGGTNWKCVACGVYHTTAIKTDGTLWSWGDCRAGQLGDNSMINKSSPVQSVAGGTNWKSVACGNYHTAAIKTDGTLWLWGYNSYGCLGDNSTVDKSSPVQIYGGSTIWKSVACRYHTAAIKTDGTLWIWGYNANGQLGDNSTVNKSSPVQTIAGGSSWKNVACGYHTAAIGE